MKLDPTRLEAANTVINEPGFKVIEDVIRERLNSMQNLENITGNPFVDGVLKGQVTGLKLILYTFADIRKQIKETEKHDEGNQ